MKRFKRYVGTNRDGAIAVIVVISMTVLMVFTAFVTDFGVAYIKASEIQNAADAACLSAGRLLPVGSGDDDGIAGIKSSAISYAEKNGVENLTDEDVILGDDVGGAYTSLEVKVPCTVESFFAKTFGIDSFSFSRSAKARISPCTETTGVAPLGVDYIQLNEAIASGNTQHIYLKYGGGDGEQGSYGAIDLDGVKGGGASDFTAWLEFGYNGLIEVGDDLLPVEKGNMEGPTTSAISERINACTHYQDQGGCTYEHFDPDCPRILKILVIEKIGSSYVKVKGFAAFILEGYSENGEVLGSYINYLDSEGLSGGGAWDSSNYGLYCLGLSS